MDAIRELASFVCKTSFTDLPCAVREHDKMLILDTLACGLAGSAAPGCRELVRWAKETGGAPQATMLVFGGRVPAVHAGMVNATLFQALDFDDTHDRAIAHTHCTCLSTALAVAESLGKVDGRRFLTAVVLGAEVMGRIGRSISAPLTFNRTGTLAYFGAVATAGKLMGLVEEELVAAFGIAYAQTGSTLQSNVDGALVKRMHPGFAVRSGIAACQLAALGVTGPVNVLEGPYGYMALYENGEYSRTDMLRGLGTEWDILHIGLKPYPCARDAAGALEAGILLHDQGVDFRRVRAMDIAMPEVAWRVSGKPYDAITGNLVVESILSGAWCGALGLIRGDATLKDFTAEGVQASEVQKLARKATLRADTTAPADAMVPVTMTVTLDDGSTRSAACRELKGSWKTPMTQKEAEHKLHACAASCLHPVSEERLRKLVRVIQSLEDRENVVEIVELMTPDTI